MRVKGLHDIRQNVKDQATILDVMKNMLEQMEFQVALGKTKTEQILRRKRPHLSVRQHLAATYPNQLSRLFAFPPNK